MEDIDVADQMWTPVTGSGDWKYLVVYGDVKTKRNWKWLWLKRKTETVILAHGPPDGLEAGKDIILELKP